MSISSPKNSVFFLTEGDIAPFEKEIDTKLTQYRRSIYRWSLSQFFEENKNYRYPNSSALVILDVPFRVQDISQLTQLRKKFSNILIFYIVSDEYSQLNLVSSKQIQEVTLHKTQGNTISQVDQIRILQAVQKFIQ